MPPARARELDINTPILIAEMNLKKLMAARRGDPAHADLPKFPGSSRDIAMLVPCDLSAGTVAAFLRAHPEPLLQSFELFDLFEDPEGVKLAKGKKSLAWSILYRSPARPL